MGILFVISHINTLQTVDVFWKTRFSDVGFSSFNCFYESVMNEGILLLCLNQSIPLCSDVLKEGKHIHIPSCDNLLQHGVNNNVTPSATNTSTKDISTIRNLVQC